MALWAANCVVTGPNGRSGVTLWVRYLNKKLSV